MHDAVATVAGLLVLFQALAETCAPPPPSPQPAPPDAARQKAAALVPEVWRTDYARDRAALLRLHGELAPFAAESGIAVRAARPTAGDRHSESALALVPNWHYVRDILLPAIRKAKP